jgi:chromate transporter
VFVAALRLGLTSFGGPIAHLGYFRREYVTRRMWLDETGFADLVALCQFLPGPASSQLGIAIGTLRAGPVGGIAAWVGFTMPSAIAMIAFGLVATSTDLSSAAWVHGLKLAAVAVVAQAVIAMAVRLTPDWPRLLVAVGAAAVILATGSPFAQLAVLAGGAFIGWLVLRSSASTVADAVSAAGLSRRVGVVALGLFAGLLVALPLLAALDGTAVASISAFFQAGALVFGGGHVVLPLLHASVVGPGFVSDGQFLAGYGAAQAVPGPLFTFAGFLGTVSTAPPGGAAGGLVAVVAIFAPSFLLIWGALPFWHELRASTSFRRALAGTNAAVVGLLAAALYTPVWTSAVTGLADVAVAGLAFAALLTGRVPPIVVVVGCALVAVLLG